jgi:signal-transduction protein with cAMP-binding, CBS, and nucleotidyltransferase domain
MIVQEHNSEDSSYGGIESQIPVGDLMSHNVVSLDATCNVFEVAREMMVKSTGSVIISRESKPIGIITERDIVGKMVKQDLTPSSVPATEIMSSPIIMVEASTNVIEASRLMVKSNIRRLAVNKGEDIVGIITDRDILTISPGLNTILENLIEMNRETGIPEESYLERGICQRCGSYVDELTSVNGLALCEDCKEEEGYYD